MVPRAYLAHSSLDKSYVEAVVQRLNRAHVIYDHMSFLPGDDFRDLIRDGLEKASLLVLFASTASLDSSWVPFELDEYEIRRIRDPSNRILVVGIDPAIRAEILPAWMRRALALLGAPSAPAAARMIQQRLAEQVAFEYRPPFVGREDEISEFRREMFPRAGEQPPRILITSGLPGMGRRTFAARMVQDYLSLRMGPIITVREQDTPETVYLRLLDEMGEIRTRTEFAEVAARFRAMDVAARGEEFARLLAILSKANEAAFFVDDYGVFLDDTAGYTSDAQEMFEAVARRSNVFCVMIHRRRPSLVRLEANGLRLASVCALRPLDLESIKLLLAQHFRQSEVKAEPRHIDALALLVDGYPPLASLAAKLGRVYGVAAMLADTSLLADFKIRTFVPLLARIPLSDDHWRILKLLSAEVSLALDVIDTALEFTTEQTARLIRELVDFNLVVLVGDLYELSSPLREAVLRIKGPMEASEFEKLASRLREKYWRESDAIPPLPVVDATLYAIARSNSEELEEFRDILMPSTFHRVAADAYHEQDWESAEAFAKRALAAQADLHAAREILFKALVKQSKWSQAEEVLKEVQERGLRRQFYLKGFLEWKRGNLPGAVTAFRAALRVGDRSISVIRDLAHCLFRLHGDENLNEAQRLVSRALDRPNPNRFVVDLALQIAIAQHDWEEAESLLAVLERVDSEQGFHHRRATFNAARDKMTLALQDARHACSGPKPRFEMRAQLADILIEAGEYDEAIEVIDRLPSRIEGQCDIRTGLRCKLFLRQDKWREAESVWDDLLRKELPVHQGLRREILRRKAADADVAPWEREKAEAELAEIEEQPPFWRGIESEESG